MESSTVSLEITSAQLDYLIELTTLDVALSLMKLEKLETPKVKLRLEMRTNANKSLLNQLKALKHEAATPVPENSR